MSQLMRHFGLSVLVLGAGVVTVVATYYGPRSVPAPMLAALPFVVLVGAVVVDFTWLAFRE